MMVLDQAHVVNIVRGCIQKKQCDLATKNTPGAASQPTLGAQYIQQGLADSYRKRHSRTITPLRLIDSHDCFHGCSSVVS